MMESSYHPATAERFVRVRLGRPATPTAAPPPDVVLARSGAPLRPDALVVAREADGYALRRVGRVGAEGVELLPTTADAPPLCVAPDAAAVVGTVVMRWSW
jgi:hypothetical protein